MVSIYFFPFKVDFLFEPRDSNPHCLHLYRSLIIITDYAVLVGHDSWLKWSYPFTLGSILAKRSSLEWGALRATLPNCAMRKHREAVSFSAVKKKVWKLIRHTEECKCNFTCGQGNIEQFAPNRIQKQTPRNLTKWSITDICVKFVPIP